MKGRLSTPSLHPSTLSLQALTSRHLHLLSTLSLHGPVFMPYHHTASVCRLFAPFPYAVSLCCLFMPSPTTISGAVSSRYHFPPSLHVVASRRFFTLFTPSLRTVSLHCLSTPSLHMSSLCTSSSRIFSHSFSETVAVIMTSAVMIAAISVCGGTECVESVYGSSGIRLDCGGLVVSAVWRFGLPRIGVWQIGLQRFGLN